DWIVDVAAPMLGGVPVRQIPPMLHGAQWWGTTKLVEAVGVPTSVEELASATLPRTVSPCPWCGEPIYAHPCPFCGDAGIESIMPRKQRSQQGAAGTLASAAKEDDGGD